MNGLKQDDKPELGFLVVTPGTVLLHVVTLVICVCVSMWVGYNLSRIANVLEVTGLCR